MSAFYPGAGIDMVPPVLFPHIKTWYYMDCLPASEQCANPIYARPYFLSRLNRAMSQCGFQIQSVAGNTRIYVHSDTQQTIRCDINSFFPDAWDPHRHSADTLVLCGYTMPPFERATYSHIITNSTTPMEQWSSHVTEHTTVSFLHSSSNVDRENPEYQCPDVIYPSYWVEHHTAEGWIDVL